MLLLFIDDPRNIILNFPGLVYHTTDSKPAKKISCFVASEKKATTIMHF